MDSKQGKRETNRRGEIMLKAVFSRFGEEIELTDELWQYDFGQKIQVTGIELPDVCEVHFQYDNLTETKTVTGYKQEDALIIDIPNEALTSKGIIKLYIYLVSSEEGRTVNVAIMHVNRRMKPEGFEVPEDIDLFHHTLLAANEYMQQTKSAKESAETAADQAEDAKNAAEAAAGSAQASADEAKTSKENAETAVKNAEAFKTEAETAKAEAVQAAADATAAKKSAEESRAAAEESAEKAEAAKEEIQESADQIQKNAAEIDSLKEDLGNIIYKGLINGFDKDNTVGGYLRNDGNVYSDSRFVTSDYFDVHENKTYYALQMVGAVKYDNVSYICFYDSSKTFIAGGYFFASSCTSPNGSKYARVTFPNDEAVKARCMFTSIETPDKYYPFRYEYSVITKDVSELKTDVSELKTDVSELKTRKSENRLYGKTMAVLGDSMAKGHILSENQTWAYKIASRNNMTYQKVAVNGAFITTGHGDSADANCLLEQLKKITGNPDIIVIHMGTNDRVKNTEIGSWSSTNIDTTNICGALRVAFEYILEHFTSSQVMFITPYFYREQTDYIGAIENACMNIGTVHCKNNKQGGICAWNDTVKSMYFIDSVHLNELGQERVACEYEGFMRTFM